MAQSVPLHFEIVTYGLLDNPGKLSLLNQEVGNLLVEE